jgi:AraC-like DNA-binding protein
VIFGFSVWNSHYQSNCIHVDVRDFKIDVICAKLLSLRVIIEQISIILIYAGIAQGFFVAFLLNSRGVKRTRANLFLSLLLIALSFSIAHMVYAQVIFSHLSVQIYSLGDPTFFLIAPCLWLYTMELTGRQVKPSWRLLVHFSPFLVIIVVSLSVGSGMVASFLRENQRLLTIIFWITVVIQFSIYQLFIQKKWLAYQSQIRQEVSNTENVSISWVRFFMMIFLLINISFFFSLFAVIHLNSSLWLGKSIAVIFSLSVFALGYKGILQKEVFNTVIPAIQEEAIVQQSAQMRQDPGLINKLVTHMVEKKPFLDPELTLSDLARELNVSRSQLSQLINDGIGDNFYNFINKYRVEEVKKLMVDPKKKNFNMLGIALEAGFKSKSTFNLIFKRFTGLTPTEFRKNLS